MSAVMEGKTQEEMFSQLLGLLMGRFEEKELDYFKVDYCSKKVPKGWEAVEIVFRPKEI